MPSLTQKQRSDQADWLRALEDIGAMFSLDDVERFTAATVAEIRETTRGKRVGFGWSGGKDSLVLEQVCYRAGVRACCFGMTTGLEYPEFLRWVTDHMPHEVEVIANPWDLDWLAAHQDMLFPSHANIAAKWFKGIQHSAQSSFVKRWRMDMILLGRRRSDGNYIGGEGNIYTNRQGITRYSPLADWTHEQILAFIHHHRLELPPNYFWPRGFRVGTGSWPARQWTESVEHGWAEVYTIDPTIVEEASRAIHSAATFLESPWTV